jgi:hypothetical protein
MSIEIEIENKNSALLAFFFFHSSFIIKIVFLIDFIDKITVFTNHGWPKVTLPNWTKRFDYRR